MARAAKHKGSVRIISGKWRGRRIGVADVPGLRPSGDRVRETLFNWLQAHVPGSRCLDLFAGTGALGLEAASRGASEVLLVERHRVAAGALLECLETLEDNAAQVIEADVLRWLAMADGGQFDIVFVDPPFDKDLQTGTLAMLSEHGWLASGARVYVESPMKSPPPEIPAGWREVRNKKMGEVRLQLFQTPG